MQAACRATLQKVEGHSTFLATRNATIAFAKWGVTHEFFLATCNTTFVVLQVARKIAWCNMALTANGLRSSTSLQAHTHSQSPQSCWSTTRIIWYFGAKYWKENPWGDPYEKVGNA